MSGVENYKIIDTSSAQYLTKLAIDAQYTL